MYGDPTEEPSSGSEELTSSLEATLDIDDNDNDSMAEGGEPKEISPAIHYVYRGIPMQKDHSGACRPLTFSRQSSDEYEEEKYYDYSPDENKELKKVGNQAQFSDENKNVCVWDPKPLEESEVEKYLIQAQKKLVNSAQGISILVRDEEQALNLLLQCGHQVPKALIRCRMNVNPLSVTMNLWSEEECRNFERGLRMYGKDFFLIQQNKVRTRSVGELVQFYYRWKKTERHDAFEKKPWHKIKKCTLFGGTKFLDEQENPGSSRGRHSSPNCYSLLYSDKKRQKRVQERMAESHDHTASPSDTLGDLDEQSDCESIQSESSLTTSESEIYSDESDVH